MRPPAHPAAGTSIRRTRTCALALLLGLACSPAAVSAQPAGPSTKTPEAPEPAWYLDVAGGECELFVQEYGGGRDTVVVLHGGWGAEHSYLLDPFARVDSGYHLVFYDQRGSLRSPCPDSLVSVDAHVRDLERLRKQLGRDRLHLAAHSIGSYLALSYLKEHPRHTGGLVLFGAVSPTGFGFGGDSVARARVEDERSAWLERSACEEETRAEGLSRADSLLSDEELSARWRIRYTCANAFHVERWRAMEGGRAFYDQSAGQAAGRSMEGGFDATSTLRSHRWPVRVIMGDHDWVVGGPVTAEIYRDVPGVEVRLLEDTAHALWLDAPDRFPRALSAALADVTDRPDEP